MTDSQLTDEEPQKSSAKSIMGIASVIGMSALYGRPYPQHYSRPESTVEDRLRAKQKKVRRAEIKKRRKQKHR